MNMPRLLPALPPPPLAARHWPNGDAISQLRLPLNGEIRDAWLIGSSAGESFIPALACDGFRDSVAAGAGAALRL
jgi:hypothetical protein